MKKNNFGRFDLVFFFDVAEKSYSEAAAYLKKRFAAQWDMDNDGWPVERIYVSFVCATDPDNVTHVFTSAVDVIIKDAMQFSGLID